MITICQKTDTEVIMSFIRAELDSPRFRQNMLDAAAFCGCSEKNVLDPNTAPEQLRAVLLQARPGIIATLPTDIVWQEALLSAEEWSQIQYINNEPWVAFSDQTRFAVRGALKAVQQPSRTISQRMKEIHEKLQRGEKIEDIILLADPKLSKIVLIEGHVRATSFLALGLEVVVKIPVILGISQHPETWSLY